MRAAWLFLALISGCATPARQEGERAPPARLDEEFTLALGDSIVLSGTPYTITFNKVIEDSRCAQGMTCVWEGNARIEIRLWDFAWPPEGEPRSVGVTGFDLELNTSPRFPTEPYDTGFVMELRRLEPLPRAGAQTQAYTVTLVARKK